MSGLRGQNALLGRPVEGRNESGGVQGVAHRRYAHSLYPCTLCVHKSTIRHTAVKLIKMTHSSSIALPILSTLHYQLFHNDFARLHNPFLKGLQALSSASSSPLSSPSCHGRTGSDSESVCLCPTHSPSASPPVGLSSETEGGVLGV